MIEGGDRQKKRASVEGKGMSTDQDMDGNREKGELFWEQALFTNTMKLVNV